MNTLEVRDLSVHLRGRQVLSGVNLSLSRGECVGLIGPNGAGKTTLLRAILGLVPAKGVSPLAQIVPRDRARLVSFLPQGREIAWPLRVDRTVALGRLPHLAPSAAPAAADQDAIDDALEAMDLTALADRPATELSGGEKARVLVARALAQNAPFLLADEPAAGLDPRHQISLMQTLASLATNGRGVLVSIHDLGQAMRYCSRVILLDKGRLISDGAPKKVLSREHLADVFGIDAYQTETENGPIFQAVGLSEPTDRA